MFSRIFERPRSATPAIHSGGSTPAKSIARPPISADRCKATTRRRYRASGSPTSSRTRLPMASSSAANFSSSSGLMDPPPSAARRAPPRRGRRGLSCRPAPRNEPNGDRDQRQKEQHVNEPACYVEGREAKEPENEKHNRDCP